MSDLLESIYSGKGDGSQSSKSVGSFKNPFSDFSVSSIPQKIGEASKKILGSFGSLGKFGNMTNGVSMNGIAQQLGAKAIPMGQNQVLSDNASLSSPRNNLDDVIVKLESTVTSDIIKLSVSPRIGESRNAQYSELNITHHPGTILKYDKTSSRSWDISAKLVSRNQSEASNNQAILNIIRSWVMPFYGAGTESVAADKLGAPPPVLKFSGYGDKNISPIPVVLESYSTNWPNDVDYIPTMEGEPFPVIIDVEIRLKEAYSPGEYSNFNLYEYKTGVLANAFSTAGKADLGGYGTCTANDAIATDSEFSIGSSSSTSTPSANDISTLGEKVSATSSPDNAIAKLNNALSEVPKDMLSDSARTIG